MAVSASCSSPNHTRRARTSTRSGPTISGASPCRRAGDPAPAAAHRPDAGHQLAEAERLHHVVVGAELEAEHPVELVGPGGQHDDRHVRRRAQCPADVVPVHVGQAEVEQHEVVPAGGEGRAAGADGVGVEAGVAQPVDQRRRDGVVVLHHEDAHRTIFGSRGRRAAPGAGDGDENSPDL